jgi:predicted lipoprotein with Yx(FWY)xxD motif
LVTGGLAQLWPPLTAPAVAGAGVAGKVAVLKDVNGQQVTYNGHPLYTFADDHAGQVTGQGVHFFVATPGIASISMSAGSTAPAMPAVPSGGYGY